MTLMCIRHQSGTFPLPGSLPVSLFSEFATCFGKIYQNNNFKKMLESSVTDRRLIFAR